MTKPLFPKLAPLTFSWGFIRSSSGMVAEEFRLWLAGIGVPCAITEIDCQIEEALQQLTPLTLPPGKRLFVATRSEWTACFDNGARGADLLSLMTILTDRLRCEGLLLHCATDRRMYSNKDRGEHLTHVGFQFFRPGPEASTGPVRAVSLEQYYGKWKFASGGTPLPEEAPFHCEGKRVRERLTLDMIDTCCRSFGLAPFDPSFYLPHGRLADSQSSPGDRYSVRLSLAEAREVFSLGSD